jgi:hypothetical protein
MISFYDILRGLLTILIIGALVFFFFSLFISLLPLILVIIVAVWIYNALFSPAGRNFYVYRRTTTFREPSPPRSDQDPPKSSKPSKMVEVEAQVRDSNS